MIDGLGQVSKATCCAELAMTAKESE